MRSSSLYYFKRVAEIGRINSAAEELFISQSQLSRIISDVEGEVGVKLFERDKHRLILNESGRTFYYHVNKMLNEYNNGLARTREVSESGRVHLSLVSNAGLSLAGIVSQAMREMPELRVVETAAPFDSCLRMLKNGTVNCALTIPALEGTGIYHEPVGKEGLVAIYPEGHEFSGRESVSFGDLNGQRWVSISKGYGLRDAFVATLSEVPPAYDRIIVETSSYESVASYVRQGLGIALVPRSFARSDEFCRAHFVDIEQAPEFDVALCWSNDHIVRPADERFVQVTAEFFAALEER